MPGHQTLDLTIDFMSIISTRLSCNESSTLCLSAVFFFFLINPTSGVRRHFFATLKTIRITLSKLLFM